MNFDFYLVQRIQVRDEPVDYKRGVDRWFAFDYMGAAEFEFGTLPQALRDMRKNLKDICDPKEINVQNKSIWFIGSDRDFDTAKAFFDIQLLV